MGCGQRASKKRKHALAVNWTGGSSGTYVEISGSSSATVAGKSVSGSYVCIAPQSAGQFTVPSYVLNVLPAGSGTTAVFGYTNFQSFTAPNLDIGTAYGGNMQSVDTTFN